MRLHWNLKLLYFQPQPNGIENINILVTKQPWMIFFSQLISIKYHLVYVVGTSVRWRSFCDWWCCYGYGRGNSRSLTKDKWILYLQCSKSILISSLQLDINGVKRSIESYPVLEEVADNAISADADAMPNQLMNICIVPIDNFWNSFRFNKIH